MGYRGAKDASRPRVGDVYLGTIWAGRAGDGSAGDDLATEVMLPRHTRFAINKSARGRVRCYFGKSNGSSSRARGLSRRFFRGGLVHLYIGPVTGRPFQTGIGGNERSAQSLAQRYECGIVCSKGRAQLPDAVGEGMMRVTENPQAPKI